MRKAKKYAALIKQYLKQLIWVRKMNCVTSHSSCKRLYTNLLCQVLINDLWWLELFPRRLSFVCLAGILRKKCNKQQSRDQNKKSTAGKLQKQILQNKSTNKYQEFAMATVNH